MTTETKDALQKLNDREYEQLSFYRSVVNEFKKETSRQKSVNTTDTKSNATEVSKRQK